MMMMVMATTMAITMAKVKVKVTGEGDGVGLQVAEPTTEGKAWRPKGQGWLSPVKPDRNDLLSSDPDFSRRVHLGSAGGVINRNGCVWFLSWCLTGPVALTTTVLRDSTGSPSTERAPDRLGIQPEIWSGHHSPRLPMSAALIPFPRLPPLPALTLSTPPLCLLLAQCPPLLAQHPLLAQRPLLVQPLRPHLAYYDPTSRRVTSSRFLNPSRWMACLPKSLPAWRIWLKKRILERTVIRSIGDIVNGRILSEFCSLHIHTFLNQILESSTMKTRKTCSSSVEHRPMKSPRLFTIQQQVVIRSIGLRQRPTLWEKRQVLTSRL